MPLLAQSNSVGATPANHDPRSLKSQFKNNKISRRIKYLAVSSEFCNNNGGPWTGRHICSKRTLHEGTIDW